jgi:fructosamine-3-kinase
MKIGIIRHFKVKYKPKQKWMNYKQFNEWIELYNNSEIIFQKNITEINMGYFNALYIVELSDCEIVLKIAPLDTVKLLRCERNLMQSEVNTLKFLKEKTSIPVPKVLFYDDTKKLINSDYFFMEKLDGENFRSIRDRMENDQKSSILFEIGKLNRELNEIKGKQFGYSGQHDKQTDNWENAFRNIFYDIVTDGEEAGIKLPVSYSKIVHIFEKNTFSLNDVIMPMFIHWDLWPGNVLINNGKVSGIIDWDRTIWGDPLMECYFRPEFINNDFCNGYGINLGKLNENAIIRRKLYDLYVYLVMRIACDYRGYTTHKEWAENKIESVCNDFENNY